MSDQRPGWKEILWQPIYDFVDRRWGKCGLIALALVAALIVLGGIAWPLLARLTRKPLTAYWWTLIEEPSYWYQLRNAPQGEKTLTPVCLLVHLEIVNDGDLPIQVATYALSVKSGSGWRLLQALPGQDTLYLMEDRDRAKARRVFFRKDGFLDAKLADAIAPHDSVTGWAFFEMPEGEQFSCKGAREMRLRLEELQGKEITVDIQQLPGPPGGREGGPSGGNLDVLPETYDLSKLKIESTKEIYGH